MFGLQMNIGKLKHFMWSFFSMLPIAFALRCQIVVDEYIESCILTHYYSGHWIEAKISDEMVLCISKCLIRCHENVIVVKNLQPFSKERESFKLHRTSNFDFSPGASCSFWLRPFIAHPLLPHIIYVHIFFCPSRLAYKLNDSSQRMHTFKNSCKWINCKSNCLSISLCLSNILHSASSFRFEHAARVCVRPWCARLEIHTFSNQRIWYMAFIHANAFSLSVNYRMD